jgi:uncharacterized membrane protein YuzA (DUF378 family)
MMFWSETIIMGLAGLWNIGFSMNPASRYWLVGFATLMALAMIVWPLAKRLDESRHGHK